jgi:hypothetical protein|uniref:DUF3224 domain-containing protein n=1 Tax=Desulfobacca acetoxidans TaxID=60893 RepID=A0A7C3SID9_9BACT
MAKRKATYRIFVTRREMLYVGDQPDHSLMLTELEGEPIEMQIGVAGEFISRRSVGFHDRIKGTGKMEGYAISTFQNGQVYSRFEGHRDGLTKITSGTWKVYRGTGKLTGLTGQGTFTVEPSDKPREFILKMEGDYELPQT